MKHEKQTIGRQGKKTQTWTTKTNPQTQEESQDLNTQGEMRHT